MNQQNAITITELSFVRYVLIPRAPVQGPEVDELVRLRAKIDSLLERIRDPALPTDLEEVEHGTAAAG